MGSRGELEPAANHRAMQRYDHRRAPELNRIEGAVISLQDVDSLKRSLDQTREFADTINEVAGDNFITVGPGLDYYHSGKDIYGVLDNTRARESLGFTPAYTVRGGIQRYMSYLGSHAA